MNAPALHGPVRIAGAGPTGALLAIVLQSRGIGPVDLFEARADPAAWGTPAGRSINLALAARGIRALQTAGVLAAVSPELLPMRGRLLHLPDGGSSFQPYGLPGEEIYSIARDVLNRALLEQAAARSGISIHFEHRLEDAAFAAGTATLRDLKTGRVFDVPMQPMLAADGAGSVMRRALRRDKLIEAAEDDLRHGYKELHIPADGARHRMRPDALHIWPRGGFMLIALPNADGSFTATLFLPKHGIDSFESLQHPADIENFFAREFPDVPGLIPNYADEFQRHPLGFLGTVSARPWHYTDRVALIGDAAHAIVPFHGQGMNCCFEDCLEFAACLDECSSWQAVFDRFGTARKPDTDAIAAMSLENYQEMRAHVADERFQLQQALALELERRFPRRFIPRYSMVMFHPELSYRTAMQRGEIQAELLASLTGDGVRTLDDVDYVRAQRQIESRLDFL